ncbi:MAG: hypothetical protein IJN86_07045 [Clostridia bacterium]|nr:hypothetical protein [Clostridia bacterium]
MANEKRKTFSNLCIIIGAVLILAVAAYTLYAVLSAKGFESDNKKIVALAEELMPPSADAYIEERGNSNMPVMEIEGVNVIGIIDIPTHDTKLPVNASWGTKSAKSMPCRYDGSLYDRDLIIGTVDTEGQFDFASELAVNSLLYFTDMESDRFSYSISSIKHSDKLNIDVWKEKSADLTVFVENEFSGEYTVIYCSAKG